MLSPGPFFVSDLKTQLGNMDLERRMLLGTDNAGTGVPVGGAPIGLDHHTFVLHDLLQFG